ncbi:MAG: hemolysin family protein [Ruminococcus sp.]
MPDDSGGFSESKQNKSFFRRLFRNKEQENKQQLAEEEILSLVEEGTEQGVIGDSTKDIIENLFDFDDTTVSEIMTHRTDVVAIEDTEPLTEVVKTAIDTGYSRIPVYHDDIDNIVGVLYVKDLLRYVCSDVPEDFRITDITRDVIYVPKTKNCSELFAEMTKAKIQLAIIVDEYGGTEGLLTLEDLIEDILGNIQDEYDNEDEEILHLGKGKFTLDGATPIDDVEELLDVEFPESDCDTVAGLILDLLGRIPEAGENPTVEPIKGVRLTVAKTEDRRIVSVLAEKTEEE